MINFEELNKKRILIWGYGREGQSTKHFLARHCRDAAVTVFEGKRDEFNEDDYDLIIKSPGIIMEGDDPKFTSQTELFLESFRDKTVGITGTKGKSTTSSLLFHVLDKCSGKHVVLLGNIGEPCLDYYEEIDDDTIVVFEMSCHQLKHTKVSPHVAVFLNLYEEHLDYYKTMDKYFEAKSHVTAYQSEEDFFFKGDNVPEIATKAKVHVINYSDPHYFEMKLLGEHNRYNAQFVYDIATSVYGCDPQKVRDAIAEFTALPHRLQFLGEVDGVRFYDDSISTIPGATIGAVKGIENVGCVLVGGMDRGINYDELVKFIRDTEDDGINYIFSYDSGKRIYEEVKDIMNCAYAPELKDAVELAKKWAKPGQAVVLSPASASYGYFKNFEQRGDMFKGYAGL
ncbi:MAG: UDP-N-acetylmuramoyl-L-alanine--D-glutamate ligase [Acetatifactor sp.]|nr:UDP-N-acetylmuramoyl-L-alanine--D-glutamate ligase [Acetatifactor sp.]